MTIDITSLKLIHQNFRLRAVNQSAGLGLDNREQIVSRENRVWECQIAANTLMRAAGRQALAWGDDARGRAGVFLLRICNPGVLRFTGDTTAFYKALGFSDTDIANGFTPYSDGTIFTDGTGFALPSTDGPVTLFDAAVGSAELEVSGVIGASLEPGVMFTVNGFAYRIAENDGGKLRFNPPLREAVTAGSEIEYSNPTVKMRLASDDGWSQFVSFHRSSRDLVLDFVEVFDR